MKGKIAKAFIGLALVLVAILVLGVTNLWDSLGDSYEKIIRINDPEEQSNGASDRLAKNVLEEPVNILLLGVDSNQTDQGRSDTIMVVRLHPEDKSITVVSLPRDTYTEIVGKGYKDKINHSFVYGVPTTLASVEKFFDIHIDHYATVDFKGFEKAIDELGGIEIDVEKRMKYRDVAGHLDIDLQPGLQILNGEQALGYARFRHDKQGDLGRIERQQVVIKSLLDKTTTIGSVNHIFDLMEIVGDHFKTDIPRTDMLKILATYRNVSSESLKSVTVNGRSDRFGEQNLWYYLVDEAERTRLHQILTANTADLENLIENMEAEKTE